MNIHIFSSAHKNEIKIIRIFKTKTASWSQSRHLATSSKQTEKLCCPEINMLIECSHWKTTLGPEHPGVVPPALIRNKHKSSLEEGPQILQGTSHFNIIKLFWQSEWENTPNSFYKANITSVLEPKKKSNSSTQKITDPYYSWI